MTIYNVSVKPSVTYLTMNAFTLAVGIFYENIPYLVNVPKPF